MVDRAEITEMQAGRLLDALVAEEIMGHKVVNDEIFGEMEVFMSRDGKPVYSALQPYSEDLTVARKIIDKIRELGCQDEAAFLYAEDQPEIICRAALRAVFKIRKKQDLSERKSRLKVIG